MSDPTILVGAVAYHSRVVPIWERFRQYFTDAGVSTDYVLFSNYERQADALLAGDIDIAWNTNTAYVLLEHRVGGDALLLGMRDVDADFRTAFVTRREDTVEELGELAGKRVAVGSRDSGHAAILPIHYLTESGARPDDTHLLRFDTDLGKHGDTGDSEIRVVEAVAGGDADVGALGVAMWATLRTQGHPAVADLVVTWRSPSYYHCTFTALPSFAGERASAWSSALLAMDYDDPSSRQAMDLEQVKRWLPSDKDGYRVLAQAMREQGYLE